jgi:Taurine catabolism dioxygenase TauD, TfdA family
VLRIESSVRLLREEILICLYRARKPAKRKDYPLLFSGEGGRPFFGYMRYALTGFTGSPRPGLDVIPTLTDIQADALDTIQFVAADNSLGLPQRKGDIHLISNRAHFHAREAYGDYATDRSRHLMRLILMDSEFGHTLPAELNDRWGHRFHYQHDQGKWALEKDEPISFTSNSRYEGLYLDESTSHSNG